MGEVYLAYDEKLDRPVAVKTFRADLAKTSSIHSRLQKELSHWIALGSHPNVVQCIGLEIIDSLPFIVMEWIVGEADQGTSLRDRIARGPLALQEALQYSIDISRGLVHALGASPGFIHRDIKPENVLITAARVAKLGDFGLATLERELLGTSARPISELDMDLADRRANQSTACGSISGLWSRGFAIWANNELDLEKGVGTPGYRSPEQLRGEDRDQRSDIYSIGCTFYEMLMGQVPSAVVGKEHLAREDVQFAVAALPPTVPTLVRQAILAGLAEHAADRPTTVVAFLGQLCHIYELLFRALPRQDSASRVDAYGSISRSVSLAELGRLDHAFAECRQALALEPSNPSFHSVCGVILDRLGRYDEAINAFSVALELTPHYPEVLVNRGCTYSIMNRYDDAVADYERAIELNPRLAEAYANRAVIHASRGNDEAALFDFSRALELKPGAAKMHLGRAGFLFLRGRLPEALADYQRVIDLNIGSAAALVGRGNVLYAQGKHDLAIADFDRAIEIDSTYALAYRNLVVILREQGHLKRALWYVERAAALGDKEAQHFARLGHEELAKRHYSESEPDIACEEYTKAIGFEPEAADLWFNRAMVYSGLGRLDEAIGDYTEGLRLDPLCARAYGERAILYGHLGREKESCCDFDRAIGLAPHDAGQYLNRGNHHLRVANEEEALRDYRKAIELCPQLAGAYTNMGVVYANRGESLGAYKLFTQAAELGDPYAARYARQSAEDLALSLPLSPFYPAELALDRVLASLSPHDLELAVHAFPIIATDSFLSFLAHHANEASNPAIREQVRLRLTALYQLCGSKG